MRANRTALLVIDMINDLATPGGALDSEPVGAIMQAVVSIPLLHRAYTATAYAPVTGGAPTVSAT